ncbi:MAG TPA: histidine kinase, partial [Streptosporangiaceae bacterium]|nr:histidine kinase [Streptosporangiaceae bacterium]
MSSDPWWCRHHVKHRVATDIGVAAGFVVLDTVVTLVGGSWWPARPGPLAWVMLGLQAAACASLAVRRRAPLAVVAILAAYSLALALLISPAGLLTPANSGTVWAPFGTVLAAYAPFFYQPNRRLAIAAVAVLSIIVARPWQPSVTVITVAIVRTAAGPLLAMYYDARRRLVAALTERAERAEREQGLLAEQARAEERARLAGEMHDVVTHRVSLMVLQAGALGITAKDEATRQAAEELRAAGCQALDELRDLVGILRTEPDGDQTPSTPGLPALIAESTAAGALAELAEDGDP